MSFDKLEEPLVDEGEGDDCFDRRKAGSNLYEDRCR